MNNELIGWYLNKSTGERVNFLYMNYPRLKRIMKGYQDSLYILIKNEREYSKHTGNDTRAIKEAYFDLIMTNA